MRLLNMFTPRRLGQQIGLAFAVLMLIALVVLGGLLITSSRTAVKDSVLRDYEEICRHTAGQLNGFADRPRELLVNTAAILANANINAPEAQKLILYRLVTEYPNLFERVAIVSPDGQEIISSDLTGKPAGVSSSDIFKKIASGQKPMVSPAYFSAEHRPFITVGAPILESQGLAGVLMAQVKLNSIWDIIAGIKLGAGEILIVDEQGYVLLHKEERKIYQGENLKDTPEVRAALGGQSGSREEQKNNGWLSAYAPLDALGWGLVLRQPVKDAYAFSFLMQKKAILIIVLAVLTAIGAGLLMANRITRPLKALTDATAKVGTGNLDHEIKSSRTDEIGGLLNAFDDMISRLRQARRLEKLSAIGTATSKIAHEIRNPLVGVKTFVQLLPKRFQDAKFIAQFNDTVPYEMARLEKMLGSLSDFSAIRRLNINQVNLAGLIRETLALFQEQMARENIRLNLDIASENLMLKADPDKLKQVLINLVQNALQAMPPGGGTLQLSAGLNGRGIMVKIGDTGVGMDEPQLAKLFEPFQTTKKAGLGLGLTICKEIIEQHKGAIAVQSQKGRGTEFTITLPSEP